MTEFRKVALKTGVTLNVGVSGDPELPSVILLHGFPESHRTWRGIEPLLSDRFRLIMPDQRGFAGSDKPNDVDEYKTSVLVDDVFALAETLGIERFSLLGHDWGGAVAWAAALRGDERLTRLAIVNSPHPLIFQKSLIDDSDQRAASQYITAFRAPDFGAVAEMKGWDWFFERTFAGHVDLSLISANEKQRYISEWSRPGAFDAMLNWYRASPLVIPPPGVTALLPDFLLSFSRTIEIPTLVVWGMRDKALLPVQLEGLDELVDRLRVARLPVAGHFAPWEAPEQVARALADFLASGA